MDEGWLAENFENAYRNWLLEKMHASRYGILFDFLYDTEFVWDPAIPRDSDRAENGKYLRETFSEESLMPMPGWYMDEPCNFLEFAVALAMAIDDSMMYDAENPEQAADWFWMMMSNLDLDRYDDEAMLQGGQVAYLTVSEKVNMVMQRRYDYNGYPGMFPLRKPAMDQRKVEIWYQANAYFIENYFE